MTEQKSDAKKPVYKKWWFWVIVVVALLAGLGSVGSQTEEQDTSTETANVESEEEDNDNVEKSDKAEIKFNDDPAKWLENEVGKAVGEEDVIMINYVPETNFALIKFEGSEGWSNNSTIKSMYYDIFRTLKSIASEENAKFDVDFNVVYPMADKYGNTEDEIVMKATFKNDTIKKIQYNKVDPYTVPSLADEWWDAPGVRLTDKK